MANNTNTKPNPKLKDPKIKGTKIPQASSNSSRKVLIGCLIAVAVFLALAIIGGLAVAGYWYYKSKKESIFSESSPPPSWQIEDASQDQEQEESSQRKPEQKPRTTYENKQFGFKLKMTPTWKDYKAVQKDTDGGFGAAIIDFYLPSSKADYTDLPGYVELFTINVYYIERWPEYQDFCKEAMCAGEEVGRNSKYVFTYSHISGFPPDDVSQQAILDMETIAKSIEIFEPSGSGSSSGAALSQQGIAGQAGKPAYNSNYVSGANYYANCKYRYSLYYPSTWSTEGATSNSGQVFFVGPNARVKIESLGLTSGESLAAFAARRTSVMEGNKVWSETVEWDSKGTSTIRSYFTHPDSQSMHWIQGGRGMELMAFGDGYNSQFINIKNLLGSLTIDLDYIDTCDSSSSSSNKPTSSGFNCDSWIHPNGDIEYWWYSLSQEEQDCYVKKYGDPGFQ